MKDQSRYQTQQCLRSSSERLCDEELQSLVKATVKYFLLCLCEDQLLNVDEVIFRSTHVGVEVCESVRCTCTEWAQPFLRERICRSWGTENMRLTLQLRHQRKNRQGKVQSIRRRLEEPSTTASTSSGAHLFRNELYATGTCRSQALFGDTDDEGKEPSSSPRHGDGSHTDPA